jgi:precorrin-6A/cobalt-precorrin-6A reductase
LHLLAEPVRRERGRPTAFAGLSNEWHTHNCAHGMYVLYGILKTHDESFRPGSFVWFPEGMEMEHGETQDNDVTFLFIANKPLGIRYLHAGQPDPAALGRDERGRRAGRPWSTYHAGVTLRVLILGGTGEARQLAAMVAGDQRLDVVSSLAGRVTDPARPAGRVRTGGFGGPAALAAWLAAERIGAVIDATHPFAAGITASAVTAARQAGVPLLVLRRPGWQAGPGDDWRRVPSMAAAAAALPGDRVFLTTGRGSLAAFAADERRWFLVRSVDAPEPPVPPRMLFTPGRGPFTEEGELALMRAHAINVLVSRDSGGPQTAAKLTAARRLGLPVVMVDRPPASAAPTVTTANAAVEWLTQVPGLGRPTMTP